MSQLVQKYLASLPLTDSFLALSDGVNSAVGRPSPPAKERMQQPWFNNGNQFYLLRVKEQIDFGYYKEAIEKYLSGIDEKEQAALFFLKSRPELLESFIKDYLGWKPEEKAPDMLWVAEHMFYAWVSPHIAGYKLNSAEILVIGHNKFIDKRRKRVIELNAAIEKLKKILSNDDKEFENFFLVRDKTIRDVEAAKEIADIKAMELALYNRSSHKLAEGIFVSNVMYSLVNDMPCTEHKLKEFVTCLSQVLCYEREFTSVRDRKKSLDAWMSRHELDYQYKTAGSIGRLVRKLRIPLMLIPGVNVIYLITKKAFRI